MRLIKLRKIYRIIFPMRFTALENLNNKLNSDSIKVVSFKNDLYKVTLKNNLTIILRDETHSDIKVFKQIFINQEYALVQKLMTLNAEFSKQKNIIDAGANVGYTTVYLSNIFEDANIFAIEPSQENAKIFLKNIEYLKNKSQIKLYQRALSHKPGLSFEIDRNFRDGKDWSVATNEKLGGSIEGISITEIISENKLDYISLLKIDIEGAERFIFKPENDLSFLKITKIIAIEIHDEFNIRNTINTLLLANNFLIFESGELTIGINKIFINV
jgi:FkbM family methyltransferase